MKRLFFVLVIIAALFSAANAQLVVTHELPSEFYYNQIFEGKINIAPTSETKFDIALMLPVTWQITDWNILGNTSEVKFETKTITYYNKVKESFHWLFNSPESTDAVLVYHAKPMSTGNHTLTLLWTYEAGFGSKDDIVYVYGETDVIPLAESCGDKICQGAYGESIFTCPRDCAFKYLDNIWVWIVVLIIALSITFIGVGYRIYKKYKENKAETVIPMAAPFYEQRIAEPAPRIRYVVKRSKNKVHKKTKKHAKKAVKMKHVKHKAKKHIKKRNVKHVHKKKVHKKGKKGSDFYVKTVRKLESIKKNLK